MSLGFLTEEQASRVVQAQSQGRQFLPLCGFSVPLLILLANWETPVYSALGGRRIWPKKAILGSAAWL